MHTTAGIEGLRCSPYYILLQSRRSSMHVRVHGSHSTLTGITWLTVPAGSEDRRKNAKRLVRGRSVSEWNRAIALLQWRARYDHESVLATAEALPLYKRVNQFTLIHRYSYLRTRVSSENNNDRLYRCIRMASTSRRRRPRAA